MAKNLYEVVLNLLLPFLMLSIVSSVNYSFSNKRIRLWHWKGLVILFALTAIMSVLRQWRIIRYNQINNIYLLCTAFITGLVYIILVWLYFGFLKKKNDSVLKFVFEIILTVLGLCYAACLMLYKVPTVIFLPMQFLGIGESIFTTMYLLKITGFLCGWLVCILFCIAFYKLMYKSPEKERAAAFSIFYLLSGFIYFVAVIGIINSYYRKKIKIPTGLRKAIPRLITAENAVLLVIIALLIIIALVFFVRHIKLHGEYTNPAEHRLLRRYERDCRRLGAFVLLLAVFSMVDMTAIKKRSTKLVELSPSEDFQLEGKRIYIPLEQVSDGHLHRFSWDNGRGKTVRFIIVQKKGTNFGIGFDACEVCGNVGYYERKNDIVCNRCDVVMNRNTIGLKGGCNPIPLESSIEDGGIVIDTDDLDRESGRF
ncbi:MAG: DUF2318 domain-containing protein [Treponema sp.]|nr:DUF2318 domain-containing protein [Treponema sp.]